MGKYKNIEDFLTELKKQLKGEMPRIRKEIKVYEKKVKKGELTINPTPSPQFNG